MSLLRVWIILELVSECLDRSNTLIFCWEIKFKSISKSVKVDKLFCSTADLSLIYII